MFALKCNGKLKIFHVFFASNFFHLFQTRKFNFIEISRYDNKLVEFRFIFLFIRKNKFLYCFLRIMEYQRWENIAWFFNKVFFCLCLVNWFYFTFGQNRIIRFVFIRRSLISPRSCLKQEYIEILFTISDFGSSKLALEVF